MPFKRSIQPCVVLTLGILIGTPAASLAQPRPGYEPTSTHVFPAGARRGTTVQVLVGTECAPPGTRFLMHAPGVTASDQLEREAALPTEASWPRLPTETPITYPRQWAAEVRIAPDAPLGVAYWNISCAQGGTASRPFLIGDLPELIESESNSTRETAEEIALPITVNGQIAGERDIDYFRMQLTAGQPVTCEVLARRLGSPLDPVVEWMTLSGERVEFKQFYVGEDPVIVFRPAVSGEYLVRVANLSFHGDPSHVYRLNLRSGPAIQSVFPPVARAGATQEVEFVVNDGRGDERDQPHSVRRTITIPQTASEHFHWQDAELPWLNFDFPLTSARILLEDDSRESQPVPAVDPRPLQSADDHSLPAVTTDVTADVMLVGRYDSSMDVDRWMLPVEPGQHWSLTCRPASSLSPVLPVLQLIDETGKVLKTAMVATGSDRSCRIEWTVKDSGQLSLLTRDLRTGNPVGPGYVYCLEARKNARDFELDVASDQINVTQGKSIKVKVSVLRTADCQGPIDLTVDGLPAGIQATGLQVGAGQSETMLEFTADEDAIARMTRIRIRGTLSNDNGPRIERFVKARHLGRDSEGNTVGSTHVDTLNLTVAHRPVFRLYCEEAYQYAYRGSIFLYPMTVERLDDFSEPIVLQIGDRQNRDLDGIQMRPVNVGPDETEVQLPIYLPETMAINVQSQSQLYSQAFARFIDQHGQPQSVLVLSEKRNMLRTLPPVVKLSSHDDRIDAQPQSVHECHLRLERTTNFPHAMELTLRDAPPGIKLEQQRFEPGQQDVVARIHIDESVMAGRYPVTIRGIGWMDGTEIISEAQIQVIVESR